jgi:hypothetical protein
MMFFMFWMAVMIFIPFFAPSLSVLAFGEAMCGIPWGAFQTLSTTYASEVVPTVLRPYVTAYVCMCWGAGILLSSGVVRAVAGIPGNLAWRLPFAIQWIWPVPLFIAAYFAPESPWNAVRRNKVDIARKSLMRLTPTTDDKAQLVDAKIAYIQYTTELERAETEGATFWDCFRGTNARRTEIVCSILSFAFTDHTLTTYPELCRLGSSNLVRQCNSRLLSRLLGVRRLQRNHSIRCQHLTLSLLHHRRHHLYVSFPTLRPFYHLHGRFERHVRLTPYHWRSWLFQRRRTENCYRDPVCHLHLGEHDIYRTSVLSHRGRDTFGPSSLQNSGYWAICIQSHWNLQ